MTKPTRRRFLAMTAGATLAAMPLRRPAAAPAPLRHIVVILRENHSFDNYFGSFPGARGEAGEARCLDEQPDPPHSYRTALAGPTRGSNGLCQYREEDIPNYFAYAREYALCDNYFAELKAGSEPNYFMLMAGRSPVIDNVRGEPETGGLHLPRHGDPLLP